MSTKETIDEETIENAKHVAMCAADLAEFDSQFRLLAQLTWKLALCLQRAATPMCIKRAYRLSKLARAEFERLEAAGIDIAAASNAAADAIPAREWPS